MIIFSLILLAALVALAIAQWWPAAGYLRYFRRFRTPAATDAQLPKAAVVLCLRGVDPFLDECLRRLAVLDYPRFEIRVVIDSPEDPARPHVERWQAEHPQVPIHIGFLAEPFETCTLVCSSIHQALSQLDDSIEVVALVNADTMVYPQWLRAMVAPLLHPQVGVVTGNRWYLPLGGRLGSLVRYVFNGSAVVPMHLWELTWTGALTMKRQVFGQPQFLEDLRTLSCEDHAIGKARQRAGLRVLFTPAAMMLNREECGLGNCYSFIRRQLLWTRLYHPSWTPLVVQSLGTTALLTLAGAGLLAAAAMQAWWAAALLLGGLALYFWVTVGLLAMLHRAVVRRVAAEQGESIPRMPLAVLCKLGLALPLAQGVYTAVVLSAMFGRRVQWRGIHYEVVPPHGLRRLDYRPYRPDVAPAENELSL